MLRTTLFFAQFWLTLALTVPFCLAYLLLKLLGLHRPFAGALQWIVGTWARSLVGTAGMRVHAEGLERIPAEGGICLVANHQGSMDIMLVLALVRRPVGFVAKMEGLLVPFIDLWILALDSVFLDRKDIARGKRAIDRGVRKIARGGALIIFPEGTRSRGRPLGAFRRGSFKLATRAEALVLPISIDGTAAVWERSRRIRPAEVSFIVHEPIPTAGMGSEERKALPERVRSIISSRLGPAAPPPAAEAR